jgi:hypothetical protein
MLGGLHPGHRAAPLHCRVRYFDPLARRPGIPEDVAGLVEGLSADETTLTLVNLNQSEPRVVLVQGGAYAEHQLHEAATDGRHVAVNRPELPVRLAAGCGGRITLKMKRNANPPTLKPPWDR